MKIALLTDGIYPWVMGGMQKHSYHMARYLAKSGVKVSLFHCVGKDDPIPRKNGADPEFFSIDELENIDFWCVNWPGKGVSLPGHYLRENRRYSKLIYQELQGRAEQIDLIYVQGYTGWSCLSARKEGILDTPVLVNFHGLEMFQKAPSFRVKLEHMSLRPATKWNLQSADFVSSFGGKISAILKQLGISSEKIIELPNGIEESWITHNSDEKPNATRKFAFVGRYERRKGIEELHEALRHLLKGQEIDFEFHFIGPIPDNKRLKNPRIIYHGLLRESHKIESILQNCDILVCPSHSEGMPTVILEGMACGCAIIATDVGAVQKEINDNGWLIDRISSQKLLQALRQAIEINSHELMKMQMQSIELVKKNFTWKKVTQASIESFEKCIAKFRGQ